jgi:hypothetical protein
MIYDFENLLAAVERQQLLVPDFVYSRHFVGSQALSAFWLLFARPEEHKPYYLVMIGLGRFLDSYPATSSQNEDTIANAKHIVQTVADKDGRDAMLLELHDYVEDFPDLLEREIRSGLIEDEHFGIEANRFTDRHCLLLAARKTVHPLPRLLNIDLELAQDFQGASLHFPAPYKPEHGIPYELTPQEKVLGDVQILAKLKVLINHLDTESFRDLRTIDVNFSAVENDFAGVRMVESSENFH